MSNERQRGHRPRQLWIDWTAKPATPPTASPASPAAGNHAPQLSKPRRVAARFPVPKPLPAAVAAGHFGYDDNGRPIRPSPAEVRAITEMQVEELVNVLDSKGQPTSRGVGQDFDAIIAAYAEDFGDYAGRQLEAYARRQAWLASEDRPRTNRHP